MRVRRRKGGWTHNEESVSPVVFVAGFLPGLFPGGVVALNELVVCAGCGTWIPSNCLSLHWKFKHNWKLRKDGAVNIQSNPLWKTRGTLL